MVIGKVYDVGIISHTQTPEKTGSEKTIENNSSKPSDVHFRGKWGASQVSVRHSLNLTGKKHDAYFKSLSDSSAQLIDQLDSGKSGEEKYTYTSFVNDFKAKVQEDRQVYGNDLTDLSGSKLKSRMEEKAASVQPTPQITDVVNDSSQDIKL